MHDQPGNGSLHVADLDQPAVARAAACGPDQAGVGELAAALGIERSAVQHYVGLGARARRRNRNPADQQAGDGRVARYLVIAGEGDPAGLVEQARELADVRVPGLLAGRVVLCPLPLLLHEPAELGLVDRQALFRGHLEGEFDRETVRVVQLKCLVPADGAGAPAPGLLHRSVENRRAGPERAEECCFLGINHRADVRRVPAQLGILIAERLDGRRRQLVQVAVIIAAPAEAPAAASSAALRARQQPQVADTAAQYPAQDVAAALVRGNHAVGDQHHRGAHVVGHHAQGHVGPVIPAVLLLGQFGSAVEHPPHGVDLVDVVDALQQRRHPLKAHPGIDVARRKLTDDREALLARPLAPDVLHEDEVPDLQVAVLVGNRPAVPAVFGPAVEVDLRARPARARHAHRPEVVGHPAPLNAALRHAYLVAPDPGCLVIVVIDRGPEPVLGKAEAAVRLGIRQQFPGKRYGLFLEVVPEREVPQHLEERGVPGGLADFLDVRRPDALLRARRARIGRRQLAEEIRLERHHSRIDQKQRGIVGDQAGRRHDGVPAPLEVGKETADDLCRLHQWPPFAWSMPVYRRELPASSARPCRTC